jgi:hypothetical protein
MTSNKEDADIKKENKELLKETRLAVVQDVESILNEVQGAAGKELSYIKQNINLADSDPLDDGEYNYNVRLALIQLAHVVEETEEVQDDMMDRIHDLQEGLVDKAQLPPNEEISR